jgi:hypothetical protein
VLALALMALLLWRPAAIAGRPRRLALQLAALTLFIRFAAPAVVLLNDLVYQGFLLERYEASYGALAKTRDEVEALNEADRPPALPPGRGGLLERLGHWYDRTTEGLDVEGRIGLYKARLARASEDIIQLIVVFVLQTVVFPLLFLWLGLRLLRAVVGLADD